MSDYLTPQQFTESEGVADWHVLSDGMCAFYRATFAEAARLVSAVSALPGVEGHPPAIDVRADGVTFRLITTTSDHFGPSQRDVEAAQAISKAAKALGLNSDTSGLQSLLVILGGANVAEVMPFWEAVLGYVPRPDSPAEDLVDPHDRGPAFWFEHMKELRPDGGGAVHLAVWLPREQAKARVAAALAAGGHLVRDQFAPSWWTLADSAGNECDISTLDGRG